MKVFILYIMYTPGNLRVGRAAPPAGPGASLMGLGSASLS